MADAHRKNKPTNAAKAAAATKAAAAAKATKANAAKATVTRPSTKAAAAVRQNEQTYGAEARARYGDDAVDAANEKLATLSDAEWNSLEELEAAIIEQLKAAMATGNPASADSKLLGSMHEKWIRGHWGQGKYTPQAHMGMAQMYLADPRFTEYYDSRAGEGATEFLVRAIGAHCKKE